MKKLLSITLSALISISLVACSGNNDVSESSQEPTPSPKTTATPTPTPTSTPTPTPSPSVEPSEKPEEISKLTNLLTGEETLTEEAVGARPVSIIINNCVDNLPQYGISQADVIFELPVEGNITRFLALYGDYTQIPSVCSVRSVRYYLPQLATSFDSMFVHWGANSSHGTPALRRLGIDNIDGMQGGELFGRDQDKLNAGYALEHTSVFYGEKFAQNLENRNYRIQLGDSIEAPFFNFNEAFTPANGEKMTDFCFDYGSYYSDFNYDEEKQVYLKKHNSNEQIDAVTGDQLYFDNILLMNTAVNIMPNADGLIKEIDVTGTNRSGIYISGGQMQEILWSKPTETSQLTFTTTDGEPLNINKGKTYIGVGAIVS